MLHIQPDDETAKLFSSGKINTRITTSAVAALKAVRTQTLCFEKSLKILPSRLIYMPCARSSRAELLTYIWQGKACDENFFRYTITQTLNFPVDYDFINFSLFTERES